MRGLTFFYSRVYNKIMGKITDIQKQKRNKTRVSIYIDDEFVCGLDEVAACSARLKVGDEITPEELKSVMKKSELNSAFERAVSYLSSSPRSKKEIQKYLKDKDYDGDIIAQTISKLEAYRYIDDYTYAQSYIKSKSKKYGSFRWAAELRNKGVAAEIISELLEDADTDNAAYDVAKKYMQSHRTTDKQKLKRFMAGRGFSWSAISDVVSKLAEEGAFDGDEEYYD